MRATRRAAAHSMLWLTMALAATAAGALVRAGGEFQVNTYTTSRQKTPAVAADQDGDFIVVWTSLEQDAQSWGVFAQRFAPLPVGREVFGRAVEVAGLAVFFLDARELRRHAAVHAVGRFFQKAALVVLQGVLVHPGRRRQVVAVEIGDAGLADLVERVDGGGGFQGDLFNGHKRAVGRYD